MGRVCVYEDEHSLGGYSFETDGRPSVATFEFDEPKWEIDRRRPWTLHSKESSPYHIHADYLMGGEKFCGVRRVDDSQPSALPSDPTFFMLKAENSGPPTYVHDTYESAKAEAERLVRATGKAVFVLKAIEVARPAPVVWGTTGEPKEMPF